MIIEYKNYGYYQYMVVVKKKRKLIYIFTKFGITLVTLC